ncbi:unnamed protein product [Acanthosepion pharaonis]|uniref:Uncharacterized protein n=1 Tax=Acanthosepion pharaonis TaxID=158019 RepID=A0A812BRV0_ACAPH|nr:unnamed protein product [Sepia pharaonis]
MLVISEASISHFRHPSLRRRKFDITIAPVLIPFNSPVIVQSQKVFFHFTIFFLSFVLFSSFLFDLLFPVCKCFLLFPSVSLRLSPFHDLSMRFFFFFSLVVIYLFFSFFFTISKNKNTKTFSCLFLCFTLPLSSFFSSIYFCIFLSSIYELTDRSR